MEAQLEAQIPSELVVQNETIKLTKNSRGYGWEIRIFSNPQLEIEERDKAWTARIEKLNNQLAEAFGVPGDILE